MAAMALNQPGAHFQSHRTCTRKDRRLTRTGKGVTSEGSCLEYGIFADRLNEQVRVTLAKLGKRGS